MERIEFEDSDTSEYEESSDESETPSDSDEHETSESEAEKRTSRIKRLSPIREYSFEKKTIAHDVEDLFDYNFVSTIRIAKELGIKNFKIIFSFITDIKRGRILYFKIIEEADL